MLPQYSNNENTLYKWKTKFSDMGWKDDVPFSITEFLEIESMPLAPAQEEVILSSKISKGGKIIGVLFRTRIFWDGVTESGDAFYEKRTKGGIVITTKRMIVYSFLKGWVNILPFAHLLRVSIENDFDGSHFHLEFENNLRAKLFKRMPISQQDEDRLKFFLSPEKYEDSILGTDLANARKHTREENQLLESFFSEIIIKRSTMFSVNDRLIANKLSSKKYMYKNVPKVKYW